MTPEADPEAAILETRLDQIAEGLREAIRCEVARLRRQGLPVYVAESGRVVERPEARAG